MLKKDSHHSSKIKEVDLSLMISAYNEEECLEEVVNELIKELKKSKINFELFLVNNGSNDRTKEIIDKLERKNPGIIRSMHIEKNKKLGGAVDMVMGNKIKGKIIGFTCADGEVTPEDTIKLAKTILDNPDITLVKTIRIKRRDGMRIIVSKIYNLLVKVLFGVKTKDINGWPVLVRYEDFKKMNIMHYSWIFQLEWLYQTKKMGKKFAEIVVYHQNRKGGKSKVKFADIIIFTLQMISYRIRTMFS